FCFPLLSVNIGVPPTSFFTYIIPYLIFLVKYDKGLGTFVLNPLSVIWALPLGELPPKAGERANVA
ncbi:MAG: hypothetical protein J6J01_05770, partial [Oscillospiraceae bacterium]|nr:hypothetical protein [Clostridia bacterium]MBP3698968.1 hypothetical protein [Oscillospiraceae bacterium]